MSPRRFLFLEFFFFAVNTSIFTTAEDIDTIKLNTIHDKILRRVVFLTFYSSHVLSKKKISDVSTKVNRQCFNQHNRLTMMVHLQKKPRLFVGPTEKILLDELVIEVTKHLDRKDWFSFMLVSKQFLRCGRHHTSGIDPSVDNNLAVRDAAHNGHLVVVEFLLKDRRIDPSAHNQAIREAVDNGHTAVVELLLKDTRVDPSADDNDASVLATRYGHTEVVNLLKADYRFRK